MKRFLSNFVAALAIVAFAANVIAGCALAMISSFERFGPFVTAMVVVVVIAGFLAAIVTWREE